MATAHAVTIPNASFEASSSYPTGWNSSGFVGVSSPSGGSYADNGSVPEGLNVAFLQSYPGSPATLSTTVTGLKAGTSFTASPAVGGLNEYYTIAATVTATAETAALVVRNDANATEKPSVAATWMICTSGIYPSPGGNYDDAVLGGIRLFAAGPGTPGNDWLRHSHHTAERHQPDVRQTACHNALAR